MRRSMVVQALVRAAMILVMVVGLALPAAATHAQSVDNSTPRLLLSARTGPTPG